MAETYAYLNTGWRPEIYTLTNLDLHVSCNKEYCIDYKSIFVIVKNIYK
jgi:hypothetical protein